MHHGATPAKLSFAFLSYRIERVARIGKAGGTKERLMCSFLNNRRRQTRPLAIGRDPRLHARLPAFSTET